MKKVLFALALAFVAVSCGSHFTVTGTVSDLDSAPEGAMVYLYNYNDKATTIDSVAIVDGTYKFKGDADPAKLYVTELRWPGKKNRDRSWQAMFIPEKGKLVLPIEKNNREAFGAEGGPLNAKYGEFMKDVDTKTGDEINPFCLEVFEANKDNYVGIEAVRTVIRSLEIEEIEALMAQSPALSQDIYINRALNAKKGEIATGEGMPFVDFEGITFDGTPVRLSDYVGKGNWVLCDFWASWCGPCMREMPNIRKVYDAFEGKGFMVLGICGWDNDEEMIARRIEEKGMLWHQIYMGLGRDHTDAYGIMGIPTLILFAPDGTVYKRGRELRGESMYETVKEALGAK